VREFVVPAEEAGTRLDVVLTRQMPDWSRSQIQRLIRAGQVTVGTRAARKAGEEVEAGTRIVVRTERGEGRAVPEDLPLVDRGVYKRSVLAHPGSGSKTHLACLLGPLPTRFL